MENLSILWRNASLAWHNEDLAQCSTLLRRALLSGILLTVPLQLLAYHVALLKNCDIDKPRNLAKSVTVE